MSITSVEQYQRYFFVFFLFAKIATIKDIVKEKKANADERTYSRGKRRKEEGREEEEERAQSRNRFFSMLINNKCKIRACCET